jgi:phthalate 4,5-dioxygenase oxygenase subunit
MTISMGSIANREVEHLGTADGMIIQVRRRLLRAAREISDQGADPPGVDQPELYRVRSASAVLPREVGWADALRDWHNARSEITPLDESSRFLAR